MTKEEIIEKLRKENPFSISTFKAMDIWAKQQAIAFSSWMLKTYGIDIPVNEGDYQVFMQLEQNRIESQTPPKQ